MSESRELIIARAEQAESNAEDVFFENCKFEGTKEQRRIFQAGWRCGQDYGESLKKQCGFNGDKPSGD